MRYASTLALHPLFRSTSQIELPTFDFDEGKCDLRDWRILAVEGSQFRLDRNNGESSMLVSQDGIMQYASMAGGFELELAEEDSVNAWHREKYVFDTDEISVPVDRSIETPHLLTAMTLKVLPFDVELLGSATLGASDGYIRVDRNQNHHAGHTYTAQPTTRLGLTERRLMDEFIGAAEIRTDATHESVAALAALIDKQIEYQDIPSGFSFIDTIKRGKGDCTEISDLFHAIGRHLGWHTRTVTGLVYHTSSGAFRPHAWNEVAIDGRWYTVDASWNQFPADASHVPFPHGETLAALVHASRARFEVAELQYETR